MVSAGIQPLGGGTGTNLFNDDLAFIGTEFMLAREDNEFEEFIWFWPWNLGGFSRLADESSCGTCLLLKIFEAMLAPLFYEPPP